MKKALFILFLTLGFSFSSYSFYTLTDLPTLIEESDFIVYGEICSVGTQNIKIVIHERIKGFPNSDTLQIRKFSNWSCASRYSTYQIGQEAIFFLKTSKKKNIYVIGNGNEGEILVKEGISYVKYRQKDASKAQVVEFISPYSKYILFDIQVLVEGIRVYLYNIDIIKKEYELPPPGTTYISNTEVENLSRNEFYKLVIKRKQMDPLLK